MEYETYHFISKPSKERHIEKIAAISRLWGIDAKIPTDAKVLELGAGTGDSLISMAISYPNSYFIGVDKSKSQVQKGNEYIKKLNLKNIELLEQDFSHFKSKIKKFDYIIVHGVFSWVDEKTRQGALKVIKKYLGENGVCYISFNSMPGCFFRDALIKQIAKVDDIKKSLKERVKKVRKELETLSECLLDASSYYSLGLKNEVTNVLKLTDSFLVNEILNKDYKSFSLHEFLEILKKHKLYYLSDASFVRGFSESRKEENLKDNFENFECYIDNIFPKSTRGVLITSKSFERKINLDALDSFYVSSSLCYIEGDKNFGEFKDSQGNSLEFETTKEVEFFKELEKAWSKPISLKDMNLVIRKRKILDYFSKELIDLYITDLPFTNKLLEYPKTSEYAKIQLKNLGYATNFRNEYVIFNDFQKEVFNLLDGKNKKSDILNELIKKLKQENKYDVNVYKELSEEVDKALTFFLETAYIM